MEAYIAVFEEGSYTAAAKRLDKTKAMVSTQISQLEEHLQCRLLTRSTRTIKATDIGKSYYEKAKLLLQDIDNLELSLKKDSANISGKLRIAAPTTYGEQVIMPFLAALNQRFPKLQVEVLLNDRYVDLIDEGIDAAIRIGHLQDSSLITRKLTNTAMKLCVSKTFSQQLKKPLTFDLIESLPCVLDNNLRSNDWSFITNNGTRKLKPNANIKVNSASAAANLAIHGNLICYIPDFAVEPYIKQGLLTEILADQHHTSFPIQILYPHRKHLSQRLTSFIEELKIYLANEKQNLNNRL